jgi:hypothetical protein
MSDLLQATGYAALVYVAFNYLITFGSGRPLVEWINPGRRYLPWLSAALIGGAYGSLKIAVDKYDQSYLDLLVNLVREEKAKPEVVGAASFVVFGLAVFMVAVWCWWFLPRAPQTFNQNPRDLIREYCRALRHYVRWKGGLDFAILCEVRNGQLQVIGEGADDKAILRGLNRLPGVHTAVDDASRKAEVAGQKQIWREMALDLFRRWPEFDKVLFPARQGRNVGISFDVRYGAVYAEMIEGDTAPGDGKPTGVFLFAVTLNEHEVATLTAARHFTMLHQAIRHIRTGVAKI